MNRVFHIPSYQSLEFRRCLSADLLASSPQFVESLNPVAWVAEDYVGSWESVSEVEFGEFPLTTVDELNQTFPIEHGLEVGTDGMGPEYEVVSPESNGEWSPVDELLPADFVDSYFSEQATEDILGIAEVDPFDFMSGPYELDVTTSNDLWWEIGDTAVFDSSGFESLKDVLLIHDPMIDVPDPDWVDPFPETTLPWIEEPQFLPPEILLPEIWPNESLPHETSPVEPALPEPLQPNLLLPGGGSDSLPVWRPVDESAALLTLEQTLSAADSKPVAVETVPDAEPVAELPELASSVETVSLPADAVVQDRRNTVTITESESGVPETSPVTIEGEQSNVFASAAVDWIEPLHHKVQVIAESVAAMDSEDLNLIGFTAVSTIAPLSMEVAAATEFAEDLVGDASPPDLSSLARLLIMVVDGTEELLDDVISGEMYASGSALGAIGGAAFWVLQSKRSKSKKDSDPDLSLAELSENLRDFETENSVSLN